MMEQIEGPLMEMLFRLLQFHPVQLPITMTISQMTDNTLFMLATWNWLNKTKPGRGEEDEEPNGQ